MSVKVETLENWEGDCIRCGHTRYPSCSQSQCQLDIGYAAAPNRTILVSRAEQATKSKQSGNTLTQNKYVVTRIPQIYLDGANMILTWSRFG